MNACDHPEPVAAEVHQASADAEKGLEGRHHGGGRVLGMRARHDNAIRPQELRAFVMDVLVGQEVVAVSPRLEPLEQAEVRSEPVGVACQPVPIARTQVQHRPQTRCVGNAAPVRVPVVETREPLLGDPPIPLPLDERGRAARRSARWRRRGR
jgi:hypothetical protein